MQIEYKPLSKNLKAKTIKSSLMILLLIALNSSLPAYTATVNSINIDNGRIILDAYDLTKLNIKGNDTNTVTIILPDTTLKDMYSFNNETLTNQLKSKIPSINSVEIVQYSLDPAEARIIIKASTPISPEINNDGENNKVSINLLTSKSTLNPTIEISSPYGDSNTNSNYETNIVSNELANVIEEIGSVSNDISQEKLEKIIEKDENNLWAKYQLSLLFIKKDDLSVATELNNAILKTNPYFFASYYTLGIINDMEGNIDQAIEMYRKANIIFPEYQDSHYRLGLDYLKKEEYEPATKEFKRTIAIYPEHNGALQNLGLIALKKNEKDKAKSYFKKALRSDALNNLGNLYIQSNEPKSAIKYFLLAQNLDPKNAIISYNIAKSYQMMNDKDMAIEYYEKAINLNPQMANAHYNLGIIYAHMTKNEMAIKEFQSYLTITPDSNDASKVKALITKLEKLKTNE